MLAKLRSSTSQPNSPAAEPKLVTTASDTTAQQERRTSKLKKRKPVKSSYQLDKRASAPDLSVYSHLYPFNSSSTNVDPTPSVPARYFSEPLPYTSSPVVEVVPISKRLSLQPAKPVTYVDCHRYPSPPTSLEEIRSNEIPSQPEEVNISASN